MSAVKIQTTRSTLPTTHPLHRLKRVRSTFASGSPSLGRVRSLVDYSLQNSSTKRKGKKREKSPSTYTEHLKTENVRHNLVNFLRVTRNPGDRNPRPWPEPQPHLPGKLEKGKSKNASTRTFSEVANRANSVQLRVADEKSPHVVPTAHLCRAGSFLERDPRTNWPSKGTAQMAYCAEKSTPSLPNNRCGHVSPDV